MSGALPVKVRRDFWIDPSPMLRHSVVTLLFGVAITVTITVPGIGIEHPDWFVAGVGIELLAILLSVAISSRKHLWWWILPIVALDFVALAFLRLGTDSSGSMLSYLAFFPVLVVASLPGRRHIAFAAQGSFVAVVLPVLLHPNHQNLPDLWVAIFGTITLTFVAFVIQELTNAQRVSVASMRAEAEFQAELLQVSVEQITLLEERQVARAIVEQNLRGLWAAVTEQAVIGTDLTGVIDAWNPGAEKMLGLTAIQAEYRTNVTAVYTDDELTRRALELGLPPVEPGSGSGLDALIESASRGTAEVRDWTYVRADGQTLPVQVSVTPRLGELGDIVGYLFVANDMTEVRAVAKLKDEFVGLISHELRTPLSSILGYLELMRDDEDQALSADQLQYLGVAERNANRLLRLVGDLMFTAQVESGTFQLERNPVELGGILLAAVESVAPVADAAGITVMADIAPDVVVDGDALRLAQAVDNLVSNAIKFTPRGGTVTLSLDASAAEAVVTVRDTGLGIAASEIDMLFSRFFRATTATRNAIPGVGLGLTITKAIVTAHRGTMNVESEEGVGTCFRFTLARTRKLADGSRPLLSNRVPAAQSAWPSRHH